MRRDVTLIAMAPRTLYKILEETTELHENAPAMYQPEGGKSAGNRYRMYTWNQYREGVQQFACGLRSLGIRKGDIVALHAEPSASFYIADLGIISNGSIAAALYTSLPPADHARTLAISDPKALIVEDVKTMRALSAAGVQVPHWILLNGEAEGALTFEQVRERGRETIAANSKAFADIQAETSPDDYAVLYMTSGATGEPENGHRFALGRRR